jgi:hypothetical protein
MSANALHRFDRIVKSQDGHLFTTIWIPLVSFKAVRLGWKRLQRCPIGHHWSLVTPVDETALSPDDVEEARRHHDLRIP